MLTRAESLLCFTGKGALFYRAACTRRPEYTLAAENLTKESDLEAELDENTLNSTAAEQEVLVQEPVDNLKEDLGEDLIVEAQTMPEEEDTSANQEEELLSDQDSVVNNGSDVTINLAVSEAGEVVASGSCGTNLTWELDDKGTLTISGNGDMDINFNSPWYSERDSIKTVLINDGVTSIGYSAFEHCSSLTSVTIPEGVTSIGSSAFEDCSNLTSINIPEGVTSIGAYAFYNCSSLTSITIPEGVTSIEASTFYNCSSLTSITIPEGVTSIGSNAFYHTKVYVEGSLCTFLTRCTVSNDFDSYSIVFSEGDQHTFNEPIIQEHGSASEPGEVVYTCSDCGASYSVVDGSFCPEINGAFCQI